MAPKVKQTIKKQGFVAKRPAAAAKRPAAAEEGDIEEIDLAGQGGPSYVASKAFKIALGKGDCPEAIRAEASRILSLGYGQNKQKQWKEVVADWKLSGWQAPRFQQ